MKPADLMRHLAQPATAPYVLDVRTPEEFAAGHVPGAVNIPLQEFGARFAEVPKDRDVVLYCRSGARSANAEALLRREGYGRTEQLEGSMLAWLDAKLPVEK